MALCGQSVLLVEYKELGDNRSYRYRLIYKDTVLLALCTFNKEKMIAGLSLNPE